MSVSNVPLLPEELGRRDVYRLPAQERLVIRMRFRDFVGRYLIHCHNMNHEDDFMMVRWDIVNTLAELTQKRREIDERTDDGRAAAAVRQRHEEWEAGLMKRRELFTGPVQALGCVLQARRRAAWRI